MLFRSHPTTQLSAEQVERLAAGDGGGQAYDIADALVNGDLEQTLRLTEAIVEHGERPGRLIYPLLNRLREVLRASELIEAGVPESQIASTMKLRPWIAKRILPQARKADRDALERGLCALADLEVHMRNGDCVDDESGLTLALARAVG